MKILSIKASAGYLILTLFVVVSCKFNPTKADKTIDHELASLNTIDDRISYLEQIFEDDQKLRRDGQDSEIMLQYGVNSKEYKHFVHRIIQIDSINLIKIEKYLDKYGHPILQDFGEIATCTPSVVIHHAQSYEARERNFERLYEAYLNGDNDGMSMFLGRMYRMKYKKSFRMKSPFNSEDEINTLITKLGLEKQKNKVLQKLDQA